MTRTVKLTRSDVELSKHFNVPLEEVAKQKLPKRGRPAGSKSKPFLFGQNDTVRERIKNFTPKEQDELMKTLEAWDRMEAEATKIEWETIAKKQEDRINLYIAENEELAAICIKRWEEIQHLKYLIKYLEGKHEDYSV